MKFIDDLYHLYRDQLSGDEDDAVAIALGVLQELDKEDMMNLIQEMTEGEMFQMLSMFLVEMLKRKMAAEGVGQNPLGDSPKTFH